MYTFKLHTNLLFKQHLNKKFLKQSSKKIIPKKICSSTLVSTVDYGLNLTVELVSDPLLVDDTTQPAGNTESESREDEADYIVGNMTFVTLTSLTSGEDDEATYYFKYIISGPSLEDVSISHHPNLTGEYPEIGYYQYTIHAIAKLNNIRAHHANISGHFWLLGKYTLNLAIKICVMHARVSVYWGGEDNKGPPTFYIDTIKVKFGRYSANLIQHEV